jgi:hypothetical protein
MQQSKVFLLYCYKKNEKFLFIKGPLADEKETAVHRNAWM